MNSKYKSHLQQSALYSFVASVTIVLMLLLSFFLVEPAVTFSQEATDTFTIRQTIVGENSFLVTAPDVTMVGTLSGLTGGTATGTTQFVVRSNNPDGYYVQIAFAYPGGPTTEAMRGDDDGSNAITDYAGDDGGEPSAAFTTTGSAQFAYTVVASSTTYLDDSFLNTGGTCGSGSMTADTCWKAPSSTAFRIMDNTGSDPYGATSTVQFKVHVPSGATPTPDAQTYTATATLSLFIK